MEQDCILTRYLPSAVFLAASLSTRLFLRRLPSGATR